VSYMCSFSSNIST